MKCTEKEQETCQVEKMGCEGCAYSDAVYDKHLLIEELVTIEHRLTELSKQNNLVYYISTNMVQNLDGNEYMKVTIDAFKGLK